jgi:hypothetical protein
MGKAEDWQERFVRAVDHLHLTIFNPRREDWDSSWVQSIDNPQFAEQVNWELDYIARAENVVFYFDPNTMSPITLMELGYVVALPTTKSWPYTPRRVYVCCPPGFWRKGNVDIICQRAGIKVVESLDALIEEFTKEE